MASTISTLILFEALLLGFLTLYGVSLGLADISTTIAQIMGPWPVYVAPSCGWFDFVCGNAVAMQMGQIFLWVWSALFRVGSTIFLVYQLITVMNIITGIPFLGFIFIGFQVLLGIYMIGLLPGGGQDI